MAHAAPDIKTRAEKIDIEIQEINRDLAVMHIKLGGLLAIMRDEELWFHRGYRDFDDYCRRTLGWGEGTAHVRIRIHRVFGKLGVKNTECVSVSHLRELTKVVTTKTQAEWWFKRIRRRNLKPSHVRKEVRTYLESKGMVEPGVLSDRDHTIGWAVTEKEATLIRKATKMIIQQDELASTYGEAVAVMAEAYLKSKK